MLDVSASIGWFLGIGAQKAGTTWLSHNLRRHPGIWDLPVKAFCYFNEPQQRLVLRAAQRGVQNQRWRRFVTRQLPSTFLRPSAWHQVPWVCRFAFSQRTDAAYRDLMTPPQGKIGGEVTPAYARLDDEGVARVHTIVPEARVIYLLRDPIQRMWSQAAMHWRKQGVVDLTQVPTATLLEYLSAESPRRNSDYLQTLSIWERHYRPEQIHVDFLERIADEPAAVLDDIFRFVGIDKVAYVAPAPSEARNVGRPPAMPDEIARLLARRYLEPCRTYHQRFNNAYTGAWLERCERLVGR